MSVRELDVTEDAMIGTFPSCLSKVARSLPLCVAVIAWAFPAVAQQDPQQDSKSTPVERYGKLLDVPINTIVPGGAAVHPGVKNPAAADAASAQRGMRYFNAFNCVGCHMGNGGGGMGPALSRHPFIYGDEPANIYLTIVQGRPNGMPAWGSLLPNEAVWDLVSYITSISNEPRSSSWGTTVSVSAPTIQQVPAELQATSKPWDYTEKSTNGQKP
jgi:cytochrome c oxidase cbb3-type subunit III